MNILNGIAGLSSDAQLILMLSLFALVLLVASSRSATRNICDLLAALGDLLGHIWFRKRKPPQDPSH